MLLSCRKTRLTASLLLCFLLLCWTSSSNAQQPSANVSEVTAQGIKLYRQGDYKEAIKVLRIAVKQHEDDADAWHYLGLSLYKHDVKNARKAFEQAIKWRPNFVAAHLDFAYVLLDMNRLAGAANEARRTIALNPKIPEPHFILGMVHLLNNAPDEALVEAEEALKLKPDCDLGFLLKSLALIDNFIEERNAPLHNSSAIRHSLFRESSENLEKYVKTLNPGDPIVMRDQLESLRLYAELADENKSSSERTVFRSSEVTTEAQIIGKPTPEFADVVRQMEISGAVRLSAIFGADGKVKGILVLHPLQEGLTESAIAAARKIKFIPATKDGRAVSQITIFEMNFQ